jgi:hypothetical protein
MIIKKYFNKNSNVLFKVLLGIGDWGLGIGDWGLGPIPNPQSPIPIPNPHASPIFIIKNIKNSINLIKC